MDKFIKRLMTSEHPMLRSAFKYNRKRFCLSIVSLILTTCVLMTATYCWFSLRIATGTANNVQLTAGKGLRVNDIGQTFKNITDNSYLLPASSVDGRNLYFPADGLPFTNITNNDMVFRSANAGDMNYNYVQLNFSLSAEADYTSIYLDKDTDVTIKRSDGESAAVTAAKDKAEKAIRTAIFYEGIEDNKPIVFSSQNKTVTTQALDEIDRTTGKYISRKKQVAVPFRDYTYGKRAIATLNQGESRRFSILIWLEGTDEVNCTSIPVMLKELELKLTFTTSWDNTVKITFVDNTVNGTNAGNIFNTLNTNKNYSLILNYNNKAHNVNNYKFIMYKSTDSEGTWYCNVPGNAYNDLEFRIVNDATDEIVYSWSKDKNGKSTYNRGTSTEYRAEQISSESSYGHWYDGEIEDMGDGGDTGEVDDDW